MEVCTSSIIVINVAADGLAPLGARTSGGTGMTLTVTTVARQGLIH